VGLDIYLYDKAQAEQNERHNVASTAFYERADYDSLTEEQKEAERAKIPAYAPWTTVPSERHPEHLFNRRYLRSSYNNGGFNHAVPEMLGTAKNDYPDERGSLYWIFKPMGREWDGDDGNLTAADIDKLRECKARAQEIAADLTKCDRLRVTTINPNLFASAPQHTDDEALAMYRAELPLHGDGWYSKGPDLNVFGDGLVVLAAIPGKASFGPPGVHLIYRASDDAFESYVQSAEIVAEFCDEAIALIERDGGARISWSG
jgi:hypothetical protein